MMQILLRNPQPGFGWVWVIEDGWRKSFGDQDSESPFPFSGLGLAEMGCHQEKE